MINVRQRNQGYTKGYIAFSAIFKYLPSNLKWNWGSQRISMQLVSMNQNWSMESSTSHPWENHIFSILVKVQKDIKCLIENKEGTTHTIRPRSGRIVYKNYCLGTWQIFFRNHFEKSVSFGARVCPPLGAGENFSWEARRLTSFSDVFKIVDLLSLYWFWIDFHFKLWWIPRYFLKKPLRKCSFGKITS